MSRLLKILFVALLVRPLVLILLGLNVRNRHKLPANGPAVIVANHNSHLDTLVLLSLYPLSKVHKIRPVAAADYFLTNRLIAWFSLHVIGIIPISRGHSGNRENMFRACHAALDKGDILVLFPEGSRGEPEQPGKPKKGLYHLIKSRSDTPLIPVVMRGLGRALPKGETLLVPFNCDVVVGDALPSIASANQMSEMLEQRYLDLLPYCLTRTPE